jgi:hypothetical protein
MTVLNGYLDTVAGWPAQPAPATEKGRVQIGVDLGQKRDPTAIAVIEPERREVYRNRREIHYLVRHLERLPLGTRYPDVAYRVAQVLANAAQHSRLRPKVCVDATGVGQPVVDLLEESVGRGAVTPVYFTHGDRRTEDKGEVKLGKAWVVSRLQALLQTGCIHLPKTPEAEALARELLDYEIRVDAQANDRYGAFRVGAHDDLVTALGLAVQEEGYWLFPEELRVVLRG